MDVAAAEHPKHPPTTGKLVARHRYIHTSNFSALADDQLNTIERAENAASIRRGDDYNVARIDESLQVVALLSYPAFVEDPFPQLRYSWLVDFRTGCVKRRDYSNSTNPPILHRKELLLSSVDPKRVEFEQVTRAAENIGLFDEPHRIGFRESWLALIRSKGYALSGSSFVPLGNDVAMTEENDACAAGVAAPAIARHLTALARNGFSAPIQALARYGLISPDTTVFDYGCGRGDDVRGLTENGIAALGWDPHYAPTNPLVEGDVVNLGFVVNVIEDFDERVHALQRAYSLARRVLAVAVMLSGQLTSNGRPYRDGWITSRSTFQKYYSQAEIAAFISQALDEEPLPVTPGVFFVFRDKALEQQFLIGRQRSTTLLQRLTRLERVSIRQARPRKAEVEYEAHKELLEALWLTWLKLGRQPEIDEVGDSQELIRQFGSIRRAIRCLSKVKDVALIQQARQARIADALVYLAIAQFAKRSPYKQLNHHLQRDIRAFFGSYASAQAAARDVLFRIADREQLSEACARAAEEGLGWLEEGQSLQLHTSLVERLPAILRVYIECGTLLYGDIRTADLVKIHMNSGKLTLMRFENFEEQPLPLLVERVKLNLKSQSVDIFKYEGQYQPPHLYLKSRYVNEEFPHYAEQAAFDETLQRVRGLDLSGFGPPPDHFQRALSADRWAVEGFQLVRATNVPSLDELCGQFLTYRQLIHCGEAQANTGIGNLPQNPESYTALYELAVNVLDPVIEYFGMIRLTYAFCSEKLAAHVRKRTAPELDQHAACERRKTGKFICSRRGAAVDFIVEHEDMYEVAHWIMQNTPFDRLYVYARDRPLHVSFGPDMKQEAIEMHANTSGRLIPRPFRGVAAAVD
ncbi:MAG TPA: DNA phosphorothioation-associated putative methyltransferase [Burkholderiales bacterium]|nr:DNA phosphorothioation-associated putative methyltransferase [Burkholderiales bacterium]